MDDSKTVFKECFKTVKNQVIFKKPFMRISLPEIFIRRKIIEIIGDKAELFGYFNMSIWDDPDYENAEERYRAHYLFSSKFMTQPTDIKVITFDTGEQKKEKMIILEYTYDDIFIENTVLEKRSEVGEIFLDILFQGFIPDIIPYDKIVQMWNECNEMNGINLNVNNTILELIVAELSRNPNKLNEEFRILLNKNAQIDLASRKMVKITQLPQLISTFASVTSAYSDDGVTESINRKRSGLENKPSPVEDAIL